MAEVFAGFRIVDKQWLLKTFTKEVEKGHYNRIPYALWRKIAHNSAKSLLIEKKTSIDVIRYFAIWSFFPVENKSEIIYEYAVESTGSNGLHDFLLDNWDKLSEEKKAVLKEKPVKKTYIDNNITYEWNSDSNDKDDFLWINDYPSVTNLQYQPLSTTAVASIDSTSYICDEVINRLIKDGVIDDQKSKDKDKEINMKTNDLFNFEFGPVSSEKFRLSPYGIAVYSLNGWVSYNTKTGEIFNVDILNFDISKLIYKMPVALDAVKSGDILIHSGSPVFVRSINSDGTVSVINYENSTVSNILPVKSPFGFNFFTKVCPLVDFNNMNADASNPFGNLLPFLMLSDDKEDFDPAMLFLMGAGNGNGFLQNPMVLYFLMNQKGNKSDLLPLLFLTNGNNPFNVQPLAANQLENSAIPDKPLA